MTDKLVSPIVQPPGAIVVSEGMTVRQEIASRVLQGFCANNAVFVRDEITGGFELAGDVTERGLVMYCLNIADLMIEETAGAEPEAE